jgi:hypothetical protein
MRHSMGSPLVQGISMRVGASVDRDRQQMPALLLLGDAQRSFVSSFEVLNYVLRPTGTDQPVSHWRSCPANGR